MRERNSNAVILALLFSTVVGVCLAQTAPPDANQAPKPAAPSNATQQLDFHPSMADLMTMMVQPRHIKLWLAGTANNWTYAAYEANELKNAFNRIGHTLPIFENTDTLAMIGSTVQQPLADVAAAIKAHDANAFRAAYARVNEACNACHLSHNKGMMVIKIPDAAMFPDQDFQPVGVQGPAQSPPK
jgi:hypothetical protein